MEFIRITDMCTYFKGAVNIGYVHSEKVGMIIDTGIDKQAIKKVIKRLEEEKLPITHLFITHAHADHYGGASYLQDNYDVYTMAPAVEEAILRNPVLEPIYLFNGVEFSEMRNKFLEGPAVRIDEVVNEGIKIIGDLEVELYAFPGHSINQQGLLVDKVLYAADCYFSNEQIEKHGLLFQINVEQTINSLEKVKSIPCKGALPGHGIYEENVIPTIDANISFHIEVEQSLIEIIEGADQPLSIDQLTKEMCQKWKVKFNTVSQWALMRSTITAYLVRGYSKGKINFNVEDYELKVNPF